VFVTRTANFVFLSVPTVLWGAPNHCVSQEAFLLYILPAFSCILYSKLVLIFFSTPFCQAPLSLCSLSSVLWKLRNQQNKRRKKYTHTHTHTYIYVYSSLCFIIINGKIYISVWNTTQFSVSISQALVHPGRGDLRDLTLGHRNV
jgi:hypothetical protein